ncbi:P-loop containing nucleoside triphosphate hydrolase protein [Pisolithus microcarpus]|nr:P-loop containing nucleoside triphosphate hydrolase protein [Pisolithus microcarpus]
MCYTEEAKPEVPNPNLAEFEACAKAQAEAERRGKEAKEEARNAIAAKEEAELQLKKGIRPVVTPSLEDIQRAKERIQYQDGFFHFAITGVAGSGKSSLVNAFCGLRNRDARAAATGTTETTVETAGYLDPNPNHQILWFDIPGAGTLKVSDWQYFNEQGLYAFDCIIVLFDNRFTATDIAILSNAKQLKIPTYIVRSKADQHIANLTKDMECDSDQDDEDDAGRRDRLFTDPRKQFIEETRKSVKTNLEKAGLPDQRVYIVSKDTIQTLLSPATERKLKRKVIDEIELFTRLRREVIDEIELLTDIRARVVSPRNLHKRDTFSSTVIRFTMSAASVTSTLLH